jgi:hypothetical protein
LLAIFETRAWARRAGEHCTRWTRYRVLSLPPDAELG